MENIKKEKKTIKIISIKIACFTITSKYIFKRLKLFASGTIVQVKKKNLTKFSSPKHLFYSFM